MPTYEYSCENKHTYLETRPMLTEQIKKRCDECGKELSRKYDAVGVSFNGSGFYQNDKKEK